MKLSDLTPEVLAKLLFDFDNYQLWESIDLEWKKMYIDDARVYLKLDAEKELVFPRWLQEILD